MPFIMMRTEGARLFDDFLDSNGIGPSAAAQQLNVSASTVLDLRRGRKRPKAALAARIAKWTDGAVPEAAWLTARELADIKRVQPLAMASASSQRDR